MPCRAAPSPSKSQNKRFTFDFSPEFADEPYKKRMSADGKHEITMATNYIGHCILNEELLDLLAKGGQDGDYARIVVVSSLAFMLASQMQKVEKFDLDARHSKYDTTIQR